MKCLFQVTCPREIKYDSKSFAYQIKKKSYGHSSNAKWFKILIIHRRTYEENNKCFCKGAFSVVTRYYDMYNGRTHRDVDNFSWNGNFETYKEAENKVKKLVAERGNGSQREWERFFKARTSNKHK